MLILSILAAFCCVCSSAGLPDYRLPGDVIPHHYDLQILTHIDEAHNFTFLGVVVIQLNVTNETKSIILHSKELLIDENNIRVFIMGERERISVVNVKYNIHLDFFILKLAELLKIGEQIELTIPFAGILQTNIMGFYRSSYSLNGSDVWLATTLFQSIYARRAFPCLDEPGMKATFSLTLGRRLHYSAISNMPLLRTLPIENMDGWVWDEFEKSPPMSTYLLSYTISDFSCVVASNNMTNVLIRIWARSEVINQANYAAEVAPKLLSFYEDYYNIPYPLPKLDLVAIPDIIYTGMEDWGIVKYLESSLLYNNDTPSVVEKMHIGEIIAHELAHQWFGNLVTMKWWTDIWLNEGFATLMGSIAYDFIEPYSNALNHDLSKYLQNVFESDALDSSHPISADLRNLDEINQIFDSISYDKGAVLLRMLNYFLGKEVFKRGITNYLKNYAYLSTETNDLWRFLTQAAHESNRLPLELQVETIMDNWTKKSGYPLITVIRDYSKNTAEISQVQYKNRASNISSVNETWWVPLSYISEESICNLKIWHSGETSKTLSGMPSKGMWVLFNIESAGVYRVNYDEDNWSLLVAALRKEDHSEISELNRFQLVADSLALSSSNRLPYKITLRLLQYLSKEKKNIPWIAALQELFKIDNILFQFPEYHVFNDFLCELLTPEYIRIGGLQADLTSNLETTEHNINIIVSSCNIEVKLCVESAVTMFNNWMNSKNNSINLIPEDLSTLVYCNGVKYGGRKEWKFVWQRYKEEHVENVKISLLSALGCTKDVTLLNRLLEYSVTENSHMKMTESHLVFQTISISKVGYKVSRQFLYSRVEDILKTFPDLTQLDAIGMYLKNVADYITTDQEYMEFYDFVNSNKKFQQASLLVNQALESISDKLKWIKDHKDTIIQILKELTNENKM